MTDIVTLDSNNFDEIVNKEHLILVDFYAPTCAPCRKMMVTIEEIATEYKDKVVVAKIDGSVNTDIASKQSVSGIPTSILYKDGKEVNRLNGQRPKSYLVELIEGEYNVL